MVSFEKAFNLYAFVVDVHSSKLIINISYFTTLFKLHGDSLVVLYHLSHETDTKPFLSQ